MYREMSTVECFVTNFTDFYLHSLEEKFWKFLGMKNSFFLEHVEGLSNVNKVR